MVRRGERSDVPFASFAATQKTAGFFVVANEPPYDPRCRERASFTTSIATFARLLEIKEAANYEATQKKKPRQQPGLFP